MSVEEQLKSQGYTLPAPAAPAANYVPFVVQGGLVYVSGQLPMGPAGLIYKGKVGPDVSIEEATKAAELCALNLIAQVKAACGGDLERVQRVVKLNGFVNCPNDFEQQPAVINGASNLMVTAFGDKGRHARAAVGTNALPFNATVEIDGVFAIV